MERGYTTLSKLRYTVTLSYLAPNYKKFNEAIELIARGGAMCIKDAGECVTVIETFMHDELVYNNACEKAKEYVYANKGATEKILRYIQEKRLLTS